jgi:signal transduction histidine kinase
MVAHHLMMPIRVALPFVATGAAALGRTLVARVLAEESPLLFFIPAVLLCAQVGGLWPGLACCLFSGLVVAYFMFPPYGSFAVEEASDFATLGLFVFTGVAMSVLTESARRERARLLVARQAEEEARRAREEVLAIVAHDLRNPLNVIAMNTQAGLADLPEGQRWDRARARIASTRRAVATMDRLIQDLLDAESIEGRKIALNLGEHPPHEIIAEALELVRPKAEAKSLRVETSAPEDVRLRGDRDRLVRVLSNLLDNAVKFAPSGGVIQAMARVEPEHVAFAIADTGPGIPVDDLTRVFERRWSAGRGGRGGTGLGLYIAKGIVEAHGGAIRAESAVGEGSTFTFTIPRSPAPPSDPAHPKA